MATQVSRVWRREAARAEARRMREAMAAWREAHPEASSLEIEQELTRRRRKLMVRLLNILLVS